MSDRTKNVLIIVVVVCLAIVVPTSGSASAPISRNPPCPALDGCDDAELRQYMPTVPKQGQAQ